jgi:hypothetical protein
MANQKKLPGKWLFGLAAIIFIIGLIFFLVSVSKILKSNSGSRQIVAPCKVEISLPKSGKYTIYYEYQSVIDNKFYRSSEKVPGLECSLVSKKTGKNIEIVPASFSSSYSKGNRLGVGIFDFNIDEPGEYEFTAKYKEDQSEEEIVLMIEQGYVLKFIGSVFFSIMILGVSATISLAIVIITLILRRRK